MWVFIIEIPDDEMKQIMEDRETTYPTLAVEKAITRSLDTWLNSEMKIITLREGAN